MNERIKELAKQPEPLSDSQSFLRWMVTDNGGSYCDYVAATKNKEQSVGVE